jgi:hypothetical protein
VCAHINGVHSFTPQPLRQTYCCQLVHCQQIDCSRKRKRLVVDVSHRSYLLKQGCASRSAVQMRTRSAMRLFTSDDDSEIQCVFRYASRSVMCTPSLRLAQSTNVCRIRAPARLVARAQTSAHRNTLHTSSAAYLPSEALNASADAPRAFGCARRAPALTSGSIRSYRRSITACAVDLSSAPTYGHCCQTQCNAVMPSWSAALTFAPRLSNRSTKLGEPAQTADVGAFLGVRASK